MDYGQWYTSEAEKRVQSRIKSIYREAARDIDNKMADFTERYKKKEAIYAKQVKDGKITKEDFDAWKRGQVFQGERWKEKKNEILNTLYNSNAAASQIINRNTLGVFAANSNYMAYTIEKEAGANFGFGLYDEHTVARLVEQDRKLLPEWKIDQPKDYDWNNKKVNRQITQGIIQGESLEKISNRLSENLSAQNENSMKTFARTAMTGAQNAGRLDRMRQAEELDIKIEKEWMATLDGHTRDSHARLDGEHVPVNEDFSNGLEYPGDPYGKPAEVYNCRCTMVSDVKWYPSEYERRDNINGQPIRSMSYFDWEKVRKAEAQISISVQLPTPVKFKGDFDIAKSTLPPGGEWRVDDTYTAEDYRHKKLFELAEGSCVAVTDKGDIVSVCKNMNGDDRGSDLLKVAVANGGDRLDAFGDGLYSFYTKNGFEPVSWTPFNEEYAPHDWVKGRDNPEPIIFYRYTGTTTKTSYSDFLKNTKPCVGENGYDEATSIRDRLIDNAK